MMNIFLYGNEVKDKWLEEIKEEMANKFYNCALI